MSKKRKVAPNYSIPPKFFQQMNTVTVNSLKTEGNKIFICKRDDKIIDVWEGLTKHNFQSVPVLQNKGKYYGCVDLHDIMDFVIDHFGHEQLKSVKDFWAHVKKSEKFKNVTVKEVMKFPRTNKNVFHPVRSGYSLHFAIELLAREKGLHRVPVITEERDLVNMLTQSRVVEFLDKNKKVLGKRLTKPISLLGASTSGVISIKETQLAVDAFTEMQKNNISAVGVLNEAGALTGVISQTDLKVISNDGSLFYKLYQDAGSFVLSTAIEREKKHKTDKIISVSADATFENVLDKLVQHKVHRVFVVNAENKPTGVISLKDILFDLIN